MERNPFSYSGEVSGDDFWDREEERRELRRDVNDSQKVVIFSKRRMGKTSLVKEVMRTLPDRKFITVYADLYPTSSVEDFISRLISAISRSIGGSLDKAISDIRSILRSFTPIATIDDDGKPVFTFDFGRKVKPETLLEEALEAFPAYCKKKGRQGVLALDEFQQIIAYDKDHKLEAVLRSHFQTHKDVAYIFLGSKKHMMADIFSAPNRPFYHSAKMFPLGDIDRDISIECVEERFKKTGCKISRDDTEHLISLSENHIYYTQRLAHAVWNIAIANGRKVTKENIMAAFGNVIRENSDYFRSLCELLTAHQLSALRVAAHLTGNEKVFSKDFLAVHNWQKDSLKQVLDSLVEKEMLSRDNGVYKVDDIFFREWLRDRGTGQ